MCGPAAAPAAQCGERVLREAYFVLEPALPNRLCRFVSIDFT